MEIRTKANNILWCLLLGIVLLCNMAMRREVNKLKREAAAAQVKLSIADKNTTDLARGVIFLDARNRALTAALESCDAAYTDMFKRRQLAAQ